MIKAFLQGYLSLIRSVVIVLFLLFCGSVICYAFVWPLWYLATNNAGAYTLAAMLFFGLLCLFSLYRHLSQNLLRCQTSQEKRQFLVTLVITWAWRLAFLVCLVRGCMKVLEGSRLAGLVWLIVLFVLYGVYAATKKNWKHDKV